MTRAQQFVDATRYTEEFGGVEFVLRRLTPMAAARAMGSRLLGVVLAANKKPKGEVSESEREAMAEAARKLLAASMVSPKLADETDAENDAVSYEDLRLGFPPAEDGRPPASFADLLFQSIMDSGGDVQGFRKSCEDSTGGASQPESTPSADATGVAPA